MEYLKENDPKTYQKAREIEMEREAYERELKQCRTKEEVQRVKFSHAAAAMAAVKEADTNPNIPKEFLYRKFLRFHRYKNKLIGAIEKLSPSCMISSAVWIGTDREQALSVSGGHNVSE